MTRDLKARKYKAFDLNKIIDDSTKLSEDNLAKTRALLDQIEDNRSKIFMDISEKILDFINCS